jgi:hypothetical protein
MDASGSGMAEVFRLAKQINYEISDEDLASEVNHIILAGGI